MTKSPSLSAPLVSRYSSTASAVGAKEKVEWEKTAEDELAKMAETENAKHGLNGAWTFWMQGVNASRQLNTNVVGAWLNPYGVGRSGGSHSELPFAAMSHRAAFLLPAIPLGASTQLAALAIQRGRCGIRTRHIALRLRDR